MRRPAVVLLTAALVLSACGGGGDQANGASEEVFLEAATAVTPDRFTDSVLTPASTTTTTTTPQQATSTTVPEPVGAVEVKGAEPGLYGGTRTRGECDPEQLVTFLGANPDKAAAWATVQAIDPAEIPSYVASLTPVLLRRDVAVTNHGYRTGRATARQAVLQAGTAVLVDPFGVPRAKCECGNPLTPPARPVARPAYRGAGWTGFAPAAVVRVTSDAPMETILLVDAVTGNTFTRPVGSAGAGDSAFGAGTCDAFPKDPACTATTTTAPPTTETTGTTVPVGEPIVLAEITSIAGVSNGPTSPSSFVLEDDAYVTYLMTYHYFNGGALPGTIALRAADGSTYGPWQAQGATGQGGVDNAYWETAPNEVVPAGTYEVVDSDPSTWSWASDTGGRGIFRMLGNPIGGGA